MTAPAPGQDKESVQRLGEIFTLLNPNSGLREEATRLLSEVEAALETSARERDQARQAYGKAMGRAEVAEGSLEAAKVGHRTLLDAGYALEEALEAATRERATILPPDEVCACLSETGSRRVTPYIQCHRCKAFMDGDDLILDRDLAIERAEAAERALEVERERNPNRVICPNCQSNLPCESCSRYSVQRYELELALEDARDALRQIKNNALNFSSSSHADVCDDIVDMARSALDASASTENKTTNSKLGSRFEDSTEDTDKDTPRLLIEIAAADIATLRNIVDAYEAARDSHREAGE